MSDAVTSMEKSRLRLLLRRIVWTERHEIAWQLHGLFTYGSTKWSMRMSRDDAIRWPQIRRKLKLGILCAWFIAGRRFVFRTWRELVIETQNKIDRRIAYQAYIGSAQWQEQRVRALRAAERRCERCHGVGSLQVHHRTYERLGAEELGDLEVLCRRCHSTHHQDERRVQKERTITAKGCA